MSHKIDMIGFALFLFFCGCLLAPFVVLLVALVAALMVLAAALFITASPALVVLSLLKTLRKAVTRGR